MNVFFKKIIQVNLINLYYIKLYKILETYESIKKINFYYISILFINNIHYVYYIK